MNTQTPQRQKPPLQEDKGHQNKITLTLIVNGVATNVDANLNAPLHTVIPQALQQTQNTGQPHTNWQLKDESGNLLDTDRKIEDFHFPITANLFLSLKAGIGG